ncbi:sensor histidine kinase [Sphingobacterium thalpophilum]|uniref:Probable sensor-like histidine kinase YehU n=1 Tax=Sphingobacterium thalpophilum TaxID=259 RepID=A0A4U9UXD1_9SPHI|nr:histidine kinase [Sphingobacterium thalpophilum]VTR37039.1 Probable sensor-like histidine kinase YehU [Sphingobacterium thalpophilum]
MRSENVWGRWYKPQVRIFIHIVFWLLVTALYYLSLKRIGGDYVLYIVLKDLLVTGSLFYSINWIISKWVSKGKLAPLILFILFAYIWWISWTYCVWVLIEDFVPPSDERVSKYMHFWIDGGYFGLFALQKHPIFILDFLLLVSVPLAPKMVKVIVEDKNKMAVLERDKLELERDNLAMEVAFLKSQISPHFLFNTLNTIYQMSETNNPKTSESIVRLSHMIRYLLYQTNDDKVLISREVKFLQDYLTLAKLRFGPGTKVYLNFENTDEPYKIVPLILIPFVENAIKHGPERSRHDSWIKMSLKLDENILRFNISNGVNRISKRPGFGGIGIQNVKRRLDLRYGVDYSLQVKEEEDSYSVCLEIKL